MTRRQQKVRMVFMDVSRTPPHFRAGVGAVILGTRGRVLAFERADQPGSWQLPQGGLKRGESSRAAVSRELQEETGLTNRDLRFVGTYPELLVYELPRALQSKKNGLGQVQRWFYFEMRRPGREPPKPPKGEFLESTWMSFTLLARTAVEFRRPVYRRLRAYAMSRRLYRSSAPHRGRERVV